MKELPIDILHNIFSRLPLQSVLRLSCVCKLWYNIIGDPYLVRMHQARDITTEDPMFLFYFDCPFGKNWELNMYMLTDDGNHLRPTSKDPIMKLHTKKTKYAIPYAVQNSCNGLLCFAQGTNVVLCNPLRHECLMLPSILSPSMTNSYGHYGLGFDCSINTFKVVGIFYRMKRHKRRIMGAAVYVLGTGSWKEISSIPPCPLLLSRPAFVNQSLHWIVDTKKRSNVENMIVSFDIRKEEFYFTPYPNTYIDSFDFIDLIDYRGSLAAAYFSRYNTIEISLLKDQANNEWVTQCIIGIEEFNLPLGSTIISIVGCSDNSIIFYYGYHGVCHIHPENDGYFQKTMLTISTGPGTGTRTSIMEVISHRGSPVSLKNYGDLLMNKLPTDFNSS